MLGFDELKGNIKKTVDWVECPQLQNIRHVFYKETDQLEHQS